MVELVLFSWFQQSKAPQRTAQAKLWYLGTPRNCVGLLRNLPYVRKILPRCGVEDHRTVFKFCATSASSAASSTRWSRFKIHKTAWTCCRSVTPFGPHRIAGRVPHETRLRARPVQLAKSTRVLVRQVHGLLVLRRWLSGTRQGENM